MLVDWARVWSDLPVEPVGVIARLQRVRNHLDHELEAVFAQYGLNDPSFSVLAALRRRQPPYALTQRALLDNLGLTSGTVSVRIHRLVDLGLVERRPDPTDRRGTIVELTDDGRRLCETVFPHHLANEDRLLSALTPRERTQLAGLLRKLLLSFEGETRGSGDVRLGVSLHPAHVTRQLRRAVGLPDRIGLLVQSVLDDSPAAAAGLREGDLLVAADDDELHSITTLNHALAAARRSGGLQLCVERGGRDQNITVALPHPERPATRLAVRAVDHREKERSHARGAPD